jgi:two-component system chemotaxis response regulator CheY
MKPKVLIVDDSALARRTLRHLLDEIGYDVEEAADGAQALERFFLSPPELVILDMVMSGMFGLEVLGKMREMNPQVRVIVVTADIQTSTAEQVRGAGAKAILHKPVKRAELAQVLKTVGEGGETWN